MGRRPAADPLHKGTLTFRQHGVGVDLEVLEGVFASTAVDAGTRQLLRRLADRRVAEAASVLDVGCGYGPLALWLAAARPGRRVLAVDRDARAVAATALGATANRLPLVRTAGSLGYDEVGEERVDLVVSNIPAKVGPAALDHLLLDAAHHLEPGGLVAVVVIDRLAAGVAERLADPTVRIEATFPTKTYTTWVYGFDGVPEAAATGAGFDRGVYGRGRRTFGAGARRWEAAVSWSIPEFDELGHGTVAAVALLERVRPRGRVVVDGIGQGHLPLALVAAGHTGALRLVDRDLLALRQAWTNLAPSAGSSPSSVELRHRARVAAEDLEGVELAVLALPEREPVAVTAAVLGAALAGSDVPALLHGRAADVHRVLELLRRHGARRAVADAEQVRGHRAVLVVPR